MEGIQFKEIQLDTPEYQDSLGFRNKTLRVPLGMDIKNDNLEMDLKSIHIMGYLDNKIIACGLLTKLNDTEIKTRQIAVDQDYQNKGYGSKLLQFLEQKAKDLNMKKMVANVRKYAIPFYTKNGWETISEEFLEVGIPHKKMQKELN